MMAAREGGRGDHNYQPILDPSMVMSPYRCSREDHGDAYGTQDYRIEAGLADDCGGVEGAEEFLVDHVATVTPGTSAADVAAIRAQRGGHSNELAWKATACGCGVAAGAGGVANRGHVSANDARQLERVLASMPLRVGQGHRQPLWPHRADTCLPAPGVCDGGRLGDPP